MVLYIAFREGGISMAWNRDLILAQRKQLKEQYNQTGNVDLLYYLASIDTVLNIDNHVLFYKSPNFSEKINDDIKTLYTFEDFLPDIKMAFKYNKLCADLHAYRLSQKLTSEEEIFTFINDFFKSLDKELYDIFNNVYKNRKDNFQISNNRSSTITIPGLDYSYINVEESYSINNNFSSAHEYGHSIQDKLFYRTYTFDNYPFHELLAFFSQYLSILYYEKLHPEDIDDIKRAKHNFLFNIITNIKRIMYYYYYRTNCSSRTKFSMTINLMRINKIPYDLAKDTVEGSQYESFLYSIAFLTVIELLYTNDLEKSIYIVKRLIQLPKKEEYISDLAGNGICLTEHLNDFIKYTKKNHDSKILQI